MDLSREKVLRTFLQDGKLVSIPARASRRRILLEHIVTAFEPGVRMLEREVDAVLRSFYEHDWVSLRRYLIDEDLMAREDGWYWRIGGYVDISTQIPGCRHYLTAGATTPLTINQRSIAD